VFTSKITRIGLISFGLLSCLFCAEASDANSRPASLDEIQTLFNLATVAPDRERLVADITSYEPKWSEQEIAAAIEQQNEMFPDMKRLPEATQRARTNAVAAGHSGTRILHVQEWDSGNLYRLDQTDEGELGAVSPQYLKYLNNHPGTYWESFVDIDDLAFSPYRSFNVDRQLHDIQLSKTTLWAREDLWRALGLDQEVGFPLLVALADSKSFPKGRGATDADLEMLKLDPTKAESLQNGSRTDWHLEATAEDRQQNQTCFILRARTISMVKPSVESDMKFIYVVARVGHRPVCLEASVTNYTTHSSFISTREDFDSQGFPRVWKRTIITPGSPMKEIDVAFKEVALNATFNDRQVFLPVFPSNYIVSDVTSGKAAILQNPLHAPLQAAAATRPMAQKTTRPVRRVISVNRVIMLCVFGLVTLWLGIRLLRYKDNRRIR
jgi:hypothetical protein